MHGGRLRSSLGVPYLNLFLLTLLLIAVLAEGWVAEDAYISLRTIDNFVNGYGLRWNVGERVQTFTHPLWVLLLTPLYFVTREAYLTTLLTGYSLTLVTVVLLAYRSKLPEPCVSLGLVLCLLSQSFLVYSTSGLENPLCHLLILLSVNCLRAQEQAGTGLLPYSFLLSLLASSRMDYLILFGPSLLYLLYAGGRRNLWPVALGLSPFLLWELFSLVYYGSLFPNTAYAKLLGLAISRRELSLFGLNYLLVNLQRDPITLGVIALGLLVMATHRLQVVRFLSLGLFLYLAYVVSVGGDYMPSGRFLSACFVLSLPFVLERVASSTPRPQRVLLVCWTGLALAGLQLLASQKLPLLSHALALLQHSSATRLPIAARLEAELARVYHRELEDQGPRSLDPDAARENKLFDICLADAGPWLAFFQTHPWIPLQQNQRRYSEVEEVPGPRHKVWRRCEPSNAWRFQGEHVAKQQDSGPIFHGSIGIFGYYAGAQAHIVDDYGLSDAFLSRLPALRDNSERGHFVRIPPLGYEESLRLGHELIVDEQLRRLYNLTQSVTTGEIFRWQRFRDILDYNLTWKELAAGYQPASSVRIAEISKQSAEGGAQGILVDLERRESWEDTLLARQRSPNASNDEREMIEIQIAPLEGSIAHPFTVTYFSLGFRVQYTQDFQVDAKGTASFQVPPAVTALQKISFMPDTLLQKDGAFRYSYRVSHLLVRPKANLRFTMKRLAIHSRTMSSPSDAGD